MIDHIVIAFGALEMLKRLSLTSRRPLSNKNKSNNNNSNVNKNSNENI